MSKGLQRKKETKKKPTKSLTEKRAAKAGSTTDLRRMLPARRKSVQKSSGPTR